MRPGKVKRSIGSKAAKSGSMLRASSGHQARIQEAEWKDFSFLGNGTAGKSCRHGVAVLESHGLYARGTARHSHSATKVQVRILGKKLFEQVVGGAWLQKLKEGDP